MEPLMRTTMIRMTFLTVLLLTLASPARAEVRILASPGGQVGPFLDMFDEVRASGLLPTWEETQRFVSRLSANKGDVG